MTDDLENGTGGAAAATTDTNDNAGGGSGGAATAEDTNDPNDGGEGGTKKDTPTDTRTPLEKKLDAIRAGDGDPNEVDDDGDDAAADELDEDDPEAVAAAKAKKAKAAAATAADGKAKDGKEPKPAKAKPIVLALPGRGTSDADVELPIDPAILEQAGLDPKEVGERFAQLKNGYKRNKALEQDRREFETERAKFDATMREVEEAPIDYVLDHVDPKQHPAIVTTLLARLDDDQFATLAEEIERFQDDPSQRRTAAAKAREDAIDRKEKRRTTQETTKARADYANAVQEQITGLVPDELEDAEANEFYDFAGLALQRWASTQPKGTRLEPTDVPALLDKLGVLKRFNLTLPDGADEGAAKGGTRAKPAKATSDAPGKKKPAAEAPADRAARTAKELKDREERRRNATSTPAGAGAAAATTAFPRGQSFVDRMKALRKRIAG